MNGRDEELLSAYFDGELPDDEKTRAEQLLADDLAARELLDDAADLAGWIRNLPRPPAPAGMHQSVMARIHAATAPQLASSPARRPNWRRRAIWATVSAAGLLLAVVLQRQWPAPAGSERGQVAAILADHKADDAYVAAEPVVTGLATTMRMEQSEPVAVDTWYTAMSNSVDIQQRLAEALERGDAPVVGEERADLAEIGDRVVVIRYRFIDKLQLPGEVQLVLTQKGITEMTGEAAAGEAEQLGEGDQRPLAAFYVEAPESDLQSAVATFTTLDGVTDVTTNFVSTTAAAAGERMSIFDAPESGETTNRPEQSGDEDRRPLAFDAAAGGEAQDSLPASAGKTVAQSTPALPQADESAPQDRSAALGVEAAESSPTHRFQLAAPIANGYQVAVPAEQQLIKELQDQAGESLERADGESQESKLAANPSQPATQPTQRWNFFFGKPHRGPTAPPSSDRVRAVIVLVPEPAE